MKHSKTYIGVKTANDAEAKIVFSLENEIITAYFDSFETANNYLHNWVAGDENILPFHYDYYTRHYRPWSGSWTNTWDLVEMGSNETLKAWSVMLGIANA